MSLHDQQMGATYNQIRAMEDLTQELNKYNGNSNNLRNVLDEILVQETIKTMMLAKFFEMPKTLVDSFETEARQKVYGRK